MTYQIIFPAFINDFLIVLLGILVGGIPFIILGAVLSGAVEAFITEEKILKILPNNKALRFVFMCFLGNVVPVCECGNVPFARRLITKNMPPQLAMTFLLSAPVFNPLVIASTLAAFPGNYSLLFFRLFFTFLVAVGAGMLFSIFRKEQILNGSLVADIGCSAHEHEHNGCHNHAHDHKNCHHDHNHSHSHSHGHHHHSHEKSSKSRFKTILAVTKKEMLELSSIFLFGAMIASLIQVAIPRDFILQFNNYEAISIIGMMLLAFIVSICSNVDAFFALAYAQIFPTSSILAFLIFGPMLDIKAIPMLKTIFRWKAIVLLVSFVTSSVFLLTYLYYLFT